MFSTQKGERFMPNYNDIEREIIQAQKGAPDTIRRKYLKELANYLQADVLLYAASTDKPLPIQLTPSLSINEEDITSFMTGVNGLNPQKDESRKLFLIIHSHGGSLEATEQIVSYLRAKYKTIIAIVPRTAMSAATLLCCACDKIIMGKQSAIGPIDPQINGIPAHAILKEFNRAEEDVAIHPESAPIWLERIKNLPFGILTLCEATNRLSKEKAESWLQAFMLRNDNDGAKKAKEISEWLGSFQNHKTHGHPISAIEATKAGLKIENLEDDNTLQELVLSLFHATMVTFARTNCIKMLENQNGKGRYLMVNL